MNQGIEILIARMKSNPEDFAERDFDGTGKMTQGKFRSISLALKKRLAGESPGWDLINILTTQEIDALTAAYVEMERKKFSEGIIARVLEEPKQEPHGYDSGASSAGFGLSTAIGSNGVSNAAYGSVVIQPDPRGFGPRIDFNEENITTLNEMIEAWRKHE
jgi:hypothetical protein